MLKARVFSFLHAGKRHCKNFVDDEIEEINLM
jgi:hypothetical protein